MVPETMPQMGWLLKGCWLQEFPEQGHFRKRYVGDAPLLVPFANHYEGEHLLQHTLLM